MARSSNKPGSTAAAPQGAAPAAPAPAPAAAPTGGTSTDVTPAGNPPAVSAIALAASAAVGSPSSPDAGISAGATESPGLDQQPGTVLGAADSGGAQQSPAAASTDAGQPSSTDGVEQPQDDGDPAGETADVDDMFGPSFPLKVRIRNHSSALLSDRTANIYLPAAGTIEVELRDEEHTKEFGEALERLVAENYIPRDAITVEPV